MRKDRQRGVYIAEEPHRAEGAEAPATRDPTPRTRAAEQQIAGIRWLQARGELWRLTR